MFLKFTDLAGCDVSKTLCYTKALMVDGIAL